MCGVSRETVKMKKKKTNKKTKRRFCSVEPQPPTFLAPGTGFMEDNFSTDWGCRGWLQDDDSSALHFVVRLISITTSAPPQIIRP